MSTVLVLQHNPCETLGIIEQVLTACGLSAEYVRAFDGQQVPKRMRGYAGLVLMGGPMSVYEQTRYPWLLDELHLLDRAVKDEAPILGVCLGSQMLATVLGAEVHRGDAPEIGWHDVRLGELAAADELWSSVAEGHATFPAFHWHSDVYDLPADGEPLASSALTPCQAFVYGRNAYGVLFHMEVTSRIVADMVAAFGDELRGAAIEGDALLEESDERLTDLHHIGRPVFQAWATLALQHSE